MAIAIDVNDLGHAAADPSSTTIAFTTGSAVASGGFIVVSVHWFSSTATLSSVAGGGLTWTIDKQGKAGSSSDNMALVSAQAPSGLASSTTITATISAASFARAIGGTSFTGVATSTPVDTTSGPTVATGTTWATPSMTLTAGSVLVATGFDETSNHTNTPATGCTEAIDWQEASGPTEHATVYRIEAGGGSFTAGGTWSGSATAGVVGVAYLAAAGGGGGPTVKRLAALGAGT